MVGFAARSSVSYDDALVTKHLLCKKVRLSYYVLWYFACWKKILGVASVIFSLQLLLRVTCPYSTQSWNSDYIGTLCVCSYGRENNILHTRWYISIGKSWCRNDWRKWNWNVFIAITRMEYPPDFRNSLCRWRKCSSVRDWWVKTRLCICA